MKKFLLFLLLSLVIFLIVPFLIPIPEIENWDIALWNLTKYTYSLSPEKRLNEIDTDVLIITGDSDTVVKTENSVRLAQEIPDAKIRIIDNCGHVPQEECPPLYENGDWIY